MPRCGLKLVQSASSNYLIKFSRRREWQYWVEGSLVSAGMSEFSAKFHFIPQREAGDWHFLFGNIGLLSAPAVASILIVRRLHNFVLCSGCTQPSDRALGIWWTGALSFQEINKVLSASLF